jgi:hypothetical protein
MVSRAVNVQLQKKQQYLLLSRISRRLLLATLSPVGRIANCPTATPMLLHENNAILTIYTVLLSEFTVDGGPFDVITSLVSLEHGVYSWENVTSE